MSAALIKTTPIGYLVSDRRVFPRVEWHRRLPVDEPITKGSHRVEQSRCPRNGSWFPEKPGRVVTVEANGTPDQGFSVLGQDFRALRPVAKRIPVRAQKVDKKADSPRTPPCCQAIDRDRPCSRTYSTSGTIACGASLSCPMRYSTYVRASFRPARRTNVCADRFATVWTTTVVAHTSAPFAHTPAGQPYRSTKSP